MTIKRVSPFISQCKKRPVTYIGGLIYPYGKVTHPFCKGIDFAHKRVTLSSLLQSAKAEAHAPRVARVVVVDVAIAVDVAKGIRVTDVRRTQPPDVRRAAQTI